MQERICPFCGKPIGASLVRCPYCREAIPSAVASSGSRKTRSEGASNIRRGLLWALLAAVIYYFAGGHSSLTPSFTVPGFVTQYLVPLLFLAGVAMALYGAYQRLQAR
ncbi:MAG TPA: hypothetical protein VGH37_05680 [Candidatus Acidoferrum sp.]|jgi:hypothetical protein